MSDVQVVVLAIMFQFLIGSLKTQNLTRANTRKLAKFQFLIGSLKMLYNQDTKDWTYEVFQFLIGSLKT